VKKPKLMVPLAHVPDSTSQPQLNQLAGTETAGVPAGRLAQAAGGDRAQARRAAVVLPDAAQTPTVHLKERVS